MCSVIHSSVQIEPAAPVLIHLVNQVLHGELELVTNLHRQTIFERLTTLTEILIRPRLGPS